MGLLSAGAKTIGARPRYPSAVDPQRWQRVCDLFEAARELRGAAREAVLASAPEVRADVEELLEHHEAERGALSTDEMASDIGKQIGPYRIDALLGEGGMAHVYRAEGPDGPVALKRLRPELCREAVVVERFRREAEIGRGIRHANVVRTLDLIGADTLVLEYVAGRTLAQRIEGSGPVGEDECRHVAREILRALVAIHDAGAVHRDLKPSNVMLTLGGGVRLMDLGIALPLEDLLRLSRTGQFVGTVRYAAPEQLTGAKAPPDPRTDLYALGLLIYELAAGRHPIPDGGMVSIMRAHLDEDPEPLGSVNPEVTPFLATLTHALLAKEPAGRPASAAAVLAILEQGEDAAWWREQQLSHTGP